VEIASGCACSRELALRHACEVLSHAECSRMAGYSFGCHLTFLMARAFESTQTPATVMFLDGSLSTAGSAKGEMRASQFESSLLRLGALLSRQSDVSCLAGKLVPLINLGAQYGWDADAVQRHLQLGAALGARNCYSRLVELRRTASPCASFSARTAYIQTSSSQIPSASISVATRVRIRGRHSTMLFDQAPPVAEAIDSLFGGT
jgi:hypothetical protein